MAKEKKVNIHMVYCDTPVRQYRLDDLGGWEVLAFDLVPQSKGKLLGLGVSDPAAADKLARYFEDMARKLRARKVRDRLGALEKRVEALEEKVRD